MIYVIVNGLLGYHICHLLIIPSLMLCILHSLMDMFLRGTTIFAPIQVSQPCLLLPKLVPRAVSDIEHELFSFPVHFGGLGICYPMSASEQQYDFSKAPLQGFVDLVLSQKSALCPEVIHHQNDPFRHLCSLTEQSLSAQLQSTISNCPPPLFSVVWRGVPLPGCQHFHQNSMVLPFIKVNSLLWLYAINVTIALCVWQGFYLASCP